MKYVGGFVKQTVVYNKDLENGSFSFGTIHKLRGHIFDLVPSFMDTFIKNKGVENVIYIFVYV